MIKVSVIVPVYNSEKHLNECLDSICNQTLTDIEIICVDDGSTDSSYEILEDYRSKDSRFKLYRQENKYAGAARNLGKSHATGEYLVFWDSDDFFNLDALEKLYNQAKSVDADVCICAGNYYMESKQKISPNPACLTMSHVPEGDVFNRFTNPKYYLNVTNDAAWDMIFKREYIEGLGLDFQPIRNANDVYFTMNAIGLADRITVINERLVNYRMAKSEGLMATVSKSPLSAINAWMDIAKNLEKHDGFGEQSFANKAIGSMVYTLQNINDWDAFCQAIEALKDGGLAQMHIFPRDNDYYYNPWNGECIKHLYNDTIEEIAIFISNSLYNQKVEALAEKRIINQELSNKKKQYKELEKTRKKEAESAKRERKALEKKVKSLNASLEKANKETEKAKKQLEETRSSWSYKIGNAIVWLPGKIKRIFKR